MNIEQIREKNRLKMAAWRASKRISREELSAKRLVATQDKIKTLTPTQSAYLAGLIDSDGGIYAFMKSHKPTGKTWPYASLRVVNTNLRMIEWVIKTTGVGSLCIREHKDTHKGVRPMYIWDCGSQ